MENKYGKEIIVTAPNGEERRVSFPPTEKNEKGEFIDIGKKLLKEQQASDFEEAKKLLKNLEK